MATQIDYKQISETNYKILKAILEDETTLLEGVAKTIQTTWNREIVSELIFALINRNKYLCNEIKGWDLNLIEKAN